MKRIFNLLIITFIFSSCATVFTGTRDTISFDSNPEGAMVYKDGLELCKTPCRVSIKRSINDEDIEFKLDGYKTRVFTLDKEFNVVSVINLGNLLGWAIDVATGSIMKYDRKGYDLNMEKDNRTALKNPKEIHINSNENVVNIYVMQE